MRKYSEKKIAEDKTGEGYIFQMFYNELSKAKKPVELEEETEVLKAMGYDLEDIMASKTLQRGLEMAKCAVNDEVYEDGKPQPVDYYHFTDANGKAIKGWKLEWYVTKEIKEACNDFKFKVKLLEAVRSYLICEWGTMNPEADRENDEALKTGKRIVGRYTVCKRSVAIETAPDGKTVIKFTSEIVKEFISKLENSETIKQSEKTGAYSVYVHVTPESKLYVGMSKEPETRYGYNGNHYKKQPAFYEAIQKYGWHNIDHYVITDELTEEEAEALEREAIQKLKAITEGYNRQEGGKGGKPVTCLNDGNIFNSLKEATEFYNLSDGFICKVCKGIEKTAKGLQFEYLQRA